MAAGVPGVLETSRVCMAFAVYRTPNGTQQVVALVGADPNVGKRFPVPDAPGSAENMSPDAVIYDVSDRELIQVTTMPAEVEVNRHRASIERQIDGHGAFLGVPFLFTSYLTAAVLGVLIGLVVVSQTVYANTMENIEEYATLRALGASQAFVARIVLAQALICGVVGSILGLLVVVPCISYAKSLISWIYTPWWLLLVMVIPSLAMCSLASIASVRSALTVEPGRVFRA